MTPEKALETAIAIVGGNAALAREISTPDKTITGQAIGQWKRCPPGWVLPVAAAVRKARKLKAPTIQQLCPGFTEQN